MMKHDGLPGTTFLCEGGAHPMNENEIAGLTNSADTIRAAIRELGF